MLRIHFPLLGGECADCAQEGVGYELRGNGIVVRQSTRHKSSDTRLFGSKIESYLSSDSSQRLPVTLSIP